MNLELQIKEELSKAILASFSLEINPSNIFLNQTKKEFEGTYTFTTFTIIKQTKLSPEATGEKIGQYLVANSKIISGFNVVKGFLNLVIATEAWHQTFISIYGQDHFGQGEKKNKKVMVEYSSPNTNKPLHLGHLRNNFLGYSVAQILHHSGYDVTKVNLVNDRGIHICKSMLAYTKFGNGETPEKAGLKGDHLVGKYYVEFDKWNKSCIKDLEAKGLSKEEAEKQSPALLEAQQMLKKWEDGDTEVVQLWKTMNEWVYQGFDVTYKTIGVDFDKYYYESNTYLLGKDIVEEGLKNGVFYKKDNGSVWINLTEEGLDEKLVLRADGTSVYITQDLGTAELKYKEFGCEKSIYVVGDEQNYHFKVLQLILKKLGKSYADGVFHLTYGMVELPSGRMKSREGTVVDADDLVAEMIVQAESETVKHGKANEATVEDNAKLYHMLGLGALKFFLLRVDPKKSMLFDPNESIQLNGDTGPYVQYTHARARSIIRKATEQKVDFKGKNLEHYKGLEKAEQELIYTLSRYPMVVADAAEQYAPSQIAQYLLQLAGDFNRMYHDISIMMAPDNEKAFRVALTDAVTRTIKSGMNLLGIQVPEKM